MNVSKSLRFEVLKRDGHACTYCGAKAPDVQLHVDHVMPTALGGTDDPSNLTTACQDCNAGKGSTHPDAPSVQAVDAKHLQWRAAVALAAQESQQVDPELQRVFDEVTAMFERYYKVGPAELDHLRNFYEKGLPADVIIASANIAAKNDSVSAAGVFAYTVGVCRKKLSAIHERAQQIIAEQEGA